MIERCKEGLRGQMKRNVVVWNNKNENRALQSTEKNQNHIDFRVGQTCLKFVVCVSFFLSLFISFFSFPSFIFLSFFFCLFVSFFSHFLSFFPLYVFWFKLLVCSIHLKIQRICP